jgi:hypothetical protein
MGTRLLMRARARGQAHGGPMRQLSKATNEANRDVIKVVSNDDRFE